MEMNVNNKIWNKLGAIELPLWLLKYLIDC